MQRKLLLRLEWVLMGEHFLLQGVLETLSPEVISFLRKDPANWKVLQSASMGLCYILWKYIGAGASSLDCAVLTRARVLRNPGI